MELFRDNETSNSNATYQQGLKIPTGKR